MHLSAAGEAGEVRQVFIYNDSDSFLAASTVDKWGK